MASLTVEDIQRYIKSGQKPLSNEDIRYFETKRGMDPVQRRKIVELLRDYKRTFRNKRNK